MQGVGYKLIECADLSTQEPKPLPKADKAPSQVALDIAQPASTTERPSVITKEFMASGALLLITTAAHAIANRLMDSNRSVENEELRIAPFLTNMAIAPFSNKVLRGNWREVDSHTSQLCVLTAHVASALTFDAALFLLPGGTQTSFIGKASSIALSNCFGHLAAMPVIEVLGKKSYSVNAPKIDEQALQANWTIRRRATYALVATSALVTSYINRQMEPDTALSIVFSTASTELSSKLFRQGAKAEDETAQKIRVLVFYTLFSVLGDATVGLAFPGVAAYPLTHPLRYLGPTGATAILSMLKQFAKVKVEESDREDKKSRKAKGTKDEAQTSCLAKESWSYLIKRKALTISAIAAPILAVGATCINTLYGGSKTVSLGIKLVQHTLCFTAMRTIFKKSVNTNQQLALALSPLVIGLGVELISKAIFPLLIPGLPATAVALGMSANLLGLLVSNKLLKVKDNDDE